MWLGGASLRLVLILSHELPTWAFVSLQVTARLDIELVTYFFIALTSLFVVCILSPCFSSIILLKKFSFLVLFFSDYSILLVLCDYYLIFGVIPLWKALTSLY